jgi:PadR family transcriptional regulator PadR
MGRESDPRQGASSVLILRLLQERPMYGYLIAKELVRRSEGYFDFKEGSLYPALHKLEREGLIRGEWQVVEQGPSRKYYHLTDKGQRALEESTQRWLAFSERLARFLSNNGPQPAVSGGAS